MSLKAAWSESTVLAEGLRIGPSEEKVRAVDTYLNGPIIFFDAGISIFSTHGDRGFLDGQVPVPRL